MFAVAADDHCDNCHSTTGVRWLASIHGRLCSLCAALQVRVEHFLKSGDSFANFDLRGITPLPRAPRDKENE